MAAGPAAADGPAGMRHGCGVIAFTAGHAKVALVRPAGGRDAPLGGWQFPWAAPRGEAEGLEAQLEAALAAGQGQLGLDLSSTLCSQPVIQSLGPEPRATTKFFMAFNVPEAELAPAEGAEAAWHELQGLLRDTAEEQVAGNQLVAVLRQLHVMLKRRYEMVFPSDDTYQEIAALLAWHEDDAQSWSGIAPKEYLEQHCREHNLPAPAFNVFERDRSGARTHFCATCLLPHLGLQLTPDAVHTTPVDALQCAAILAALYLEGALAPDCPLVSFQPAGDMAQVPHAFITEREARNKDGAAVRAAEAAAEAAAAERQKREMERHVQEEQAALQRRLDELKRQQAALAAGAPLPVPPPAVGERPSKRAKPEKAALTIGQALQQIGPDKHPLMALKELCDKCRWPQPQFEELPGQIGGLRVAVTLPQAGVARAVGPPHVDRRQAKALAAQAVVAALRQKHAPGAQAA